MKTAKYTGDISRIVRAGTSFQIRTSDFALYNDGVLASGAVDTSFKDCQFMSPLFIQSGNNTNLLTVWAGYHLNSTSYAGDIAGTTPNTGDDDVKTPKSNALMGSLLHPSSGEYMIEAVYFYYCPAMYGPYVSEYRLRTTLKSIGDDYVTIFTNANINIFSPLKPNKTEPHEVDEVIGYSPNYIPVVVTNPTGAITLDEGEISRDFTFMWATNGSSSISSIKLDGMVISSPTTYGTRTKSYTPGSYNIISTFNYNGVDYPCNSTTLNISAAPTIINEFTITSYDSLLEQAYLRISATAAANYICWVTTTWVVGMEIVGSYSTNMGNKSVSVGTVNVTQNIPTTRPNGISVNATIGGIKIEYKTLAGKVAKTANWVINQPSNLSVTPTTLSYNSLASAKSLSVTSNYPEQWTATANQPWLSLTKVTGGYSVSVSTNSGDVRTATITVTDSINGEKQTVGVTQATGIIQEYVSADPDMLDFLWDDGIQQLVEITSSGPWTITIPSAHRSWIFVDSMSGNNGDVIGVSVAENFNYSARFGTFTINSGNASYTVTVQQDGAYT